VGIPGIPRYTRIFIIIIMCVTGMRGSCASSFAARDIREANAPIARAPHMPD
jgi:hypothetical protein